MLLSSPKARLITIFKTRLIKILSQLLTHDRFHMSTEIHENFCHRKLMKQANGINQDQSAHSVPSNLGTMTSANASTPTMFPQMVSKELRHLHNPNCKIFHKS